MQAIVLAAGLGTRLRPYTHVCPKPLFPILNRPLLLILLETLRHAGCERIVVNGHHLAGKIEKAVAGIENLIYQYEPDILGTGGSLRQAARHWDDKPVLVVNGDIFHTIDPAALYSYHVRSGNRITMAMHDFPRFNNVEVRDGIVRSFLPGSKRDGHALLAFTGMHVVDPSIIDMIPERQFFHIIDLYQDLVRQGEKIGCLRVDGAVWQDIGTVGDYLELHAGLLSGKFHQPLPLPVPAGSWMVCSKAKMDVGVQLSGWGCVGKAEIGREVHLKNCVVWDDAVIEEGVCIENSIVPPGIPLV